MILNKLEVLQLLVLFQLLHAVHSSEAKDSKRVAEKSVNDDSDFLVHGGHIDGEDEDLLLLINSSFVIVDSENSTAIPIEEDDQKISEEKPNKTDSAPKQQSRLGKVKSRPPKLCRKYSEVEKYKLLGSRNQLFLANSIDEASKHFGDFYTEDDDENVSNNNVHTAWASFAFSSDTAASSCDSRCQRIRGALLRAERQRSKPNGRPRGQNRGIRPSSILDDPGLPAVQEGRMLPKRGCYLDSFVATGNCTTNHWRNEFDQLCSKCHGVFRLGDGCFPQFLNAVECNGSDTPCIYDSLTHASHGKCRPQYLSFKVLQNMGDEECENWQQQTIEIPVACQCLLQKNSNLNLLSAEPFV